MTLKFEKFVKLLRPCDKQIPILLAVLTLKFITRLDFS